MKCNKLAFFILGIIAIYYDSATNKSAGVAQVRSPLTNMTLFIESVLFSCYSF